MKYVTMRLTYVLKKQELNETICDPIQRPMMYDKPSVKLEQKSEWET
jgi:hypothetical protein